jgi:hypothetical protein
MKHFEDRQSIRNLNYESKRCWANLAEKYITEAAAHHQSEQRCIRYLNSWAQDLEWAELVTSQLSERSVWAKLVTSQLSERSIVATVLFVLVYKQISDAQLK